MGQHWTVDRRHFLRRRRCDSEPASEGLGVDVVRTKLAVYLIAAFGRA
jgi:hypothetical protein